MPNEIEQAIALLDQKIESLKKLRNQLAHEFGQVLTSMAVGTVAHGRSNGHVSRKDQIAEFIKTHGPATRAEIIEGTGVPVGTIAYALNDEARFEAREGKWHIRE